MADTLRPDAASLYGRENWIFIPTIASATLAPTVAEATAASALDISRIAFEGATPELGATTNRIRQERRAGDTESFEDIGETQYEGGDCVMAVQPQAVAGSDGKKAWEKFAAGGVTGFIGKREDVARATAVTAGQFLSSVIPVKFGPGIPVPQGSGETKQAAFRCTFAVTGKPAHMVAVLA